MTVLPRMWWGYFTLTRHSPWRAKLAFIFSQGSVFSSSCSNLLRQHPLNQFLRVKLRTKFHCFKASLQRKDNSCIPALVITGTCTQKKFCFELKFNRYKYKWGKFKRWKLGHHVCLRHNGLAASCTLRIHTVQVGRIFVGPSGHAQ